MISQKFFVALHVEFGKEILNKWNDVFRVIGFDRLIHKSHNRIIAQERLFAEKTAAVQTVLVHVRRGYY